ncbi:hypothetical protein SLE2022_386820 [Rubroshorea leprosula]
MRSQTENRFAHMNIKKKARMDRISELLECIIPHILSFQLNASYSVLDFEKKRFYDQENFENVSKLRELVYNSLHCFS